MNTYSIALRIIYAGLTLIGLSSACQPASTSVPTAGVDLTPPPVLYIADNQLFQLQSDNTTQLIARLGEEGEVFGGIRIKETILVWGKNGLQRVDIKSGKVEMAVEFDETPLFGSLVRTSNDRVVLYSTKIGGLV